MGRRRIRALRIRLAIPSHRFVFRTAGGKLFRTAGSEGDKEPNAIGGADRFATHAVCRTGRAGHYLRQSFHSGDPFSSNLKIHSRTGPYEFFTAICQARAKSYQFARSP